MAAAAVTDTDCARFYARVEFVWRTKYVIYVSSSLQFLNHCILVVLAIMFPKEFTPEAHVALDKFLSALALALSEKYR